MSDYCLGRLLVVDDEVGLMTDLCEMLAAQGFEVTGCPGAGDALVRLAQQSYDVLLTDLMMPGMDGIELLRAALEIDPDMVGILMTGQGTVPTAVEAMKIGAFDYITKPFKLASLLPVIHRALSLRRIKSENLQLRDTVAIYELSTSVAFPLDPQAIMNKVVDAALEQCEAEEASLMLTSRDGDGLLVAVARGRDDRDLLGERLGLGQGIAGWVAQQREPVILFGEVDDIRFAPVNPRREIRASISVPMIARGRLVGVLNVNSTRRKRPFSLGQVKALTILSATAAAALDSALLFSQLRVSEEKYRSLVENVSEVITVIDAAGTIEYQSPAIRRVLGYTSGETHDRSLFDLVHPEDEPLLRGVFQEVCSAPGTSRSAEHRYLHREGTWRVLDSAAHCVSILPGGKKIILTSRDVTEQKRAESDLRGTNLRLQAALEQVRAAQEQLVQQERLRALGQMASGIAHDFNNALAPILGFSELLLLDEESLRDPERSRRYLELIHTTARDAAEIVNRLREFYRPRDESAHLLLLDLKELVEQAVALTQPKWKDQAQARGATIEIEMELRRVPSIRGDAAELRELLTNLIFNAVDAMPDGGRLTLSTAEEEGWVVLEVSDTGVGMTEEIRRHCLEPFFSTKGERGTGLGLAMVSGIVERHEGRIELRSASGEGTSVIIRFSPSGRVADAPEPGEAEVIGPLHVLIADDEPLVREMLRLYLEDWGHTVTTAAGGRDAIERIDREEFDVILTDRAMPETSGDEVAAFAAARRPGTPVLMVTGFGDLMRHVGECPPGVTAVVPKPPTAATLRKALADALRGAGSGPGGQGK